MRAVVLALALLLAGCTRPLEPAEPVVIGRLAGACALPYLNATPAEPAPGEEVRIEAVLVNCGEVPLELWGSCRGVGGLSLEVQHEGQPYRLEGSNPSALPTSQGGWVGSCGPARFEPEMIIEPGTRAAASWRWNGSLAHTYAWHTGILAPSPGYSITTTTEVLPPKPGVHELTFSYSHPPANMTWTRRASVDVAGGFQEPDADAMSAWRADPTAVENGTAPLPATVPPVVALAANASLLSRGWHEPRRALLGIEPAGDHYEVRVRLRLLGIDEERDVTLRITAGGRPLAAPVAGLPDCRERALECEFHVGRRLAQELAGSEAEPELVWHAAGLRGTYALRVGDVLVDANDGRLLGGA